VGQVLVGRIERTRRAADPPHPIPAKKPIDRHIVQPPPDVIHIVLRA